MRYPAGQKAETHDKIVHLAARSFREHGSEGKGIAKIMADLGLTHGGFYKHFDSKEDLFEEVVARGLKETGDMLVKAAEAAPKGSELRAIIEMYLSPEHVASPGAGCVLAAMLPELSRQPLELRKQINRSMDAYVARLGRFMTGRTVAERRQKCFVLFASLAGVVATARAIVNRNAKCQMLSSAKDFYVSSFCRAMSR